MVKLPILLHEEFEDEGIVQVCVAIDDEEEVALVGLAVRARNHEQHQNICSTSYKTQ